MTESDQKLIENPAFLKWIFHSNPDIETYWEQYLLEHPDEKNHLLELKESLTVLKFSNERLSFSEKKELAKSIIRRVNIKSKQNNRKSLIHTFMKYAAVAITFTVLGGLLVYLNIDKESLFNQQVNQNIQIPSAAHGPLLITSNGENVNLKESNSTVDYSSSGVIILNNDSVIQPTTDLADELNQIIIPYGNQSKIVLSDSTVVWLNAGSRLNYPTLFKNKTREVLLFGEAFFEVAKNPEKPFIVKTSDLEIRVLGTQFNVSAYEEDDLIQTVLKEGSVNIRRKGTLFFEHDVMLKPNQMASFNKTTNDNKINTVDPDYYILWTKGLISFDDIDLNRVIKKVERFYNISIGFSDPDKKIMRISGKLDLKQGRKEVMEYLEKVSLSRFEQDQEDKYTLK